MNILLNIGFAWLVCQLIKVGLAKKLSSFWKCGGMPSSHSALVAALSTAVGLQQGFGSVPAAISYVLLFVVVHDAVRIRKHHTFNETLAGLAVGIVVVALLSYV